MTVLVTVKPPGREEYALTLTAPPTYSFARGIGCEQATLYCELNDRERLDVLGATVRIHGTGWQGIVIRRPGRDEPLIAQGWGWCATLKRREAVYADTAVDAWKIRTAAAANKAASVDIEGTTVRVTLPKGADAAPANGCWRLVPTTSDATYAFDWSRASVDWGVTVYYGTSSGGTEPTSWQSASVLATAGSGATTGSASVHVTSAHDAVLVNFSRASSTATADITTNHIKDPHVYGTAVISPTTHDILTDVIDNEIAVGFLPAGAVYRAWIDAETTVVEPCVFPHSDAASKFAQLTKYVAYEYGWWVENVAGQLACVPHWYARSTTPDYVVSLDDAEGYDVDESGLDELVSVMRVAFHNAAGGTSYTDVTDTDTTHPLVRLGIERYGDLDVDTGSTATATTFGQLALADGGRSQVKGSVTTRRVVTSTGADIRLPDIRPGRMVRLLGLPDGQRDCIVNRVTLTADALATIELDNAPYRLDLMLARLALNK